MERPPPANTNKPKIQFKEGTKIEARDHLDNKWWEAKVLEVDFSCSEVLVHFIGWNVRHDEWIKMDSPRLQPTSRKTRRTSNGAEGTLHKGTDFKQGEEVMAVWNKIKYPAKILRLEPDGSYMIEYYDGVRKKLRPQFIRRVSGEDIPFIQNCKEELVHAGQLNGIKEEDGRQTQQVLERGRRRKSKFNIKEIFNIQQKKKLKSGSRSPSPSTPSHSSSRGDATSPSHSSPSRDEATPSGDATPQSASEDSMPSTHDLTASNHIEHLSSARAEDPADTTPPPPDSDSYVAIPPVTSSGDSVDRSLKNAGSEKAPDESEKLRQNLDRISGRKEEEDNVEQSQKETCSKDSVLPAELNCDITPGLGPVPPLLDEPLDHCPETSESIETGSEEGTPSEKENLPAVNLLDATEKPSKKILLPGRKSASTLDKSANRILPGKKSTKDNYNFPEENLGKRSRKRKRFPDEDPDGGVTGGRRKRTVNGPRPELKEGGSEGGTSINQSKSNRMAKGPPTIPSSTVLSPKKSKKLAELNPVKLLQPAVTSSQLLQPAVTSSQLLQPAVTSPPSSRSSLSGSSSSVDAKFPYLTFDFSLPPDQMLASLKEGVNIPGIGSPITMRPFSLPDGWKKWVYVRGKGLTMGKWDVYVESPDGKSFRSKMDLSRYFEANSLEHNIDDFDFVLDPQLKKIRNVWKELRKPQERALTPACEGGSSIFLTGGGSMNNLPYELMSVVPSVSSSSSSSSRTTKSLPTCNGTSPEQKSAKMSEKAQKVAEKSVKALETPPREASKANLATSSATSPNSTSPGLRVSGTASSSLPGHTPSSPGAGERGVRCNLNNCNKLFRNEKLLLQHVKHYHSHLTEILGEVLGNSPTVTDMAYLRTRVGDHCKDFETDGALLEILKKAEKRYDRQEKRHRSNKSSPTTPTTSSHAKSAISDRLKKRRGTEVELEKVEVIQEKDESPAAASNCSPVSAPPLPQTPQPAAPTTPAPPTPTLKGVDLPVTPLNTESKKGKSRVKRSSLHESLQAEAEKKWEPPPVAEDPSPPVKSRGGGAEPLSSGGATPPTWKRRPVRSPEEKSVETMTEEEVVMCGCGKGDGDGLMIQCDVCLTWQHGHCLSINTEQQVPEMYICGRCEHPRLGRQSSLYMIPTYWKANTSLPALSPPRNSESTFPPAGESKPTDCEHLDRLSRLMSELSALAGILHSLNLKLHVAEQGNHPKVFMWSSAWEETVLEDTGASVLPWEDTETAAGFLNQDFGLDFSQGDFAGLQSTDQPADEDCSDAVERVDHESSDTKEVDVKRPGSRTRSVTFSDEAPAEEPPKPPAAVKSSSNGQPGKSILREPSTSEQPSLVNGGDGGGDQSAAVGSSKLSSETSGQADFVSGSSDDFSFFDFPSLTEVKKLLPGVLKDISGLDMNPPPPPPPQPSIIPEPKLINREESRANLVAHLEYMQNLLDQQLGIIEAHVDAVENNTTLASTTNPLDCSRVNRGLFKLIKDLRAIKKASSIIPDKL